MCYMNIFIGLKHLQDCRLIYLFTVGIFCEINFAGFYGHKNILTAKRFPIYGIGTHCDGRGSRNELAMNAFDPCVQKDGSCFSGHKHSWGRSPLKATRTEP